MHDIMLADEEVRSKKKKKKKWQTLFQDAISVANSFTQKKMRGHKDKKRRITNSNIAVVKNNCLALLL